MAGHEGHLEVSQGVKFNEHRGSKAELMFGQGLDFVAGSHMEVVAGMESKLVVGAENKIGIATNTILELGAEVKYVRGWAVEIAHEGGGAYEHAFTAMAGSSKKGAFTSLRTFMAISVGVQVASVATMLSLTKTTYLKDGKLTPAGESGASTALAWCQNTAGVVMFLGTVVLNYVLRKYIHIEPLAAMTVNHVSNAFIGVRGSATNPGTGGLELKPNKFILSAGNQDRLFDKSGHEVVGYTSHANTQIEGTEDLIKIQARQLEFKTTASKGSVTVTDAFIHAWSGGDSAQPKASLKLGKVNLAPPSKIPPRASAAAPAQPAPAPPAVWGLGAATDLDNSIRLATDGGTVVSLSENWARISVDDGIMLEINKGEYAKLSYKADGAEVLLEENRAVLKFGGASIELKNGSVSIGGSLTVLDQTPTIPSLMNQNLVQQEIRQIYEAELKTKVESAASTKAEAVETKLKQAYDNRVRDLETAVSQLKTLKGAT